MIKYQVQVKYFDRKVGFTIYNNKFIWRIIILMVHAF